MHTDPWLGKFSIYEIKDFPKGYYYYTKLLLKELQNHQKSNLNIWKNYSPGDHQTQIYIAKLSKFGFGGGHHAVDHQVIEVINSEVCLSRA